VSQGEHAEITKLVEFALVAAVNSSHREGVVECIMALDEGSREAPRRAAAVAAFADSPALSQRPSTA
jgi:hypothetical protein